MKHQGKIEIVAPASPVVSLAEIKTYLRVDGSDEDTLLESLIEAATKTLEEQCGCKFGTQTWDIYRQCWPKEYNKKMWWDGVKEIAISELYADTDYYELPFKPLQSVESIKYYGTDDTEYILDNSIYDIDVAGYVPRVQLRYSQIWPTITLRPLNAIVTRGVFGFTSVPASIKEAVKIYVANMYECRGSSEKSGIPKSCMALLEPFVIRNL